jgi:hypothetical protein
MTCPKVLVKGRCNQGTFKQLVTACTVGASAARSYSFRRGWGTPCAASIMLITLTVDEWCVLPVFFPSCHRRPTKLNLLQARKVTCDQPSERSLTNGLAHSGKATSYPWTCTCPQNTHAHYKSRNGNDHLNKFVNFASKLSVSLLWPVLIKDTLAD